MDVIEFASSVYGSYNRGMTDKEKKPAGRKRKYGDLGEAVHSGKRFPPPYWDVITDPSFEPVIKRSVKDPDYLQTIKKLASEPADQP